MGNVFYEARMAMFYNKGEMAEMLGVRRHQIGKWERDEAIPCEKSVARWNAIVPAEFRIKITRYKEGYCLDRNKKYYKAHSERIKARMRNLRVRRKNGTAPPRLCRRENKNTAKIKILGN